MLPPSKLLKTPLIYDEPMRSGRAIACTGGWPRPDFSARAASAVAVRSCVAAQ